ncbi:MAG: hypothetical protein JWN16_1226 [Alphaproteobacteria bacterium]|nr:hypothetical protein [Alphaproteobacteria bacterium]
MTSEDAVNLLITWGPVLVILLVWTVFMMRFQKRVAARQNEHLELARRQAETLDRIEKKLNG